MAYGLMKDSTLVAYEIESTDGTDPANTRILWPGIVLNAGTFGQDYMHEMYRPMGNAKRTPHITQTKGQHYEVEIQSLVSETFTANDLVSLIFGTVNGTTGAVTLADPLRTFTLEYGWDDGAGPFYYLLSGCKITSISFAFRPEDLIMMTVKIIGRVFTAGTAEVTCVTTSLSGLSQTTKPGAHWKDVTWSWENGSGSVFTNPPKITEFDLTIENNLSEIRSDNQAYYPSDLAEGNLDITWAVKMVREGNEIYNIFRSDPATTAGQIRVKVVINQTSGFYMSFDMGVDNATPYCVIAERELPQGQDETVLFESYAGTLIGDPVVDMNGLA